MYRVIFKDGSKLIVESSSVFGVMEKIRHLNALDPRNNRQREEDIVEIQDWHGRELAEVKK